MIVCKVDARVPAIGREDIEQELQVIREVLATIGGELIHANVSTGQGYLVAYVSAESEVVISDIFGASDFTVETILYLKPSRGAYTRLSLRQCLSKRNGQLASRLLGVPVPIPAAQVPHPPKTPAWLDFCADPPAPPQGACLQLSQ